jgi:GTP-binding protein
MFVDRVRIWAKGGHGGRGGVSFLREKFLPDGGPDGGNGGRGGSVIIRANPHLNNLVKLKYSPHQFAAKGQPGNRKQMSGRSGEDLIIEVPPGTLISRLPQPEGQPVESLIPIPPREMPLEQVADITEPNQEFILCPGGRGGRGNMNFKSSINQAPRNFGTGEPGEEGQFLLELKSIADIGLVGYPNAGKSTLLSQMSKATPKIAPYPFTTLTPMVGVIDYEDHARLTMADIPGLIEGAHEGTGLGHEFLRHIERCRLLLFVIDMAGTDGRDPYADYQQLRKELKLYQAELALRPFLIVANKMDSPVAAANLKKFKAKARRPIIPISAELQEGVPELKDTLRQALAASSA